MRRARREGDAGWCTWGEQHDAKVVCRTQALSTPPCTRKAHHVLRQNVAVLEKRHVEPPRLWGRVKGSTQRGQRLATTRVNLRIAVCATRGGICQMSRTHDPLPLLSASQEGKCRCEAHPAAHAHDLHAHLSLGHAPRRAFAAGVWPRSDVFCVGLNASVQWLIVSAQWQSVHGQQHSM